MGSDEAKPVLKKIRWTQPPAPEPKAYVISTPETARRHDMGQACAELWAWADKYHVYPELEGVRAVIMRSAAEAGFPREKCPKLPWKWR